MENTEALSTDNILLHFFSILYEGKPLFEM